MNASHIYSPYTWSNIRDKHLVPVSLNILSLWFSQVPKILGLRYLVKRAPVFHWSIGGGRMVRWCWVNFQCRGVLLIWIRVGQGPTALALRAGGGGLDIFSLVYHFSFLSPSLWETARYRLKYCLKGPLSPKQPTNQKSFVYPTIWETTETNNY